MNDLSYINRFEDKRFDSAGIPAPVHPFLSKADSFRLGLHSLAK